MSANPAEAPLPLGARVHLSHAVIQRVAEQCGVDLLHIKGPAVHPSLRPPRSSSDVDVLVRPGQEDRLVKRLRALGWEQRSDAETSSAFNHADNWWHDDWGYADLHVSWPGPTASPDVVFATLARDAISYPIAHYPCLVPDLVGQLFVLLTHAARSPNKSDVSFAWDNASEQTKGKVLALADELGANVAVAAALGRLGDYADDPTHDLWLHYSEGGSRIDEWRARWKAARSARARLAVVRRALSVNTDHLRMELGHEPSRADVVQRQVTRITTLARELKHRRWR